MVTRVLAEAESGKPAREPRPSKLDPYKSFIGEQLEKYPRLHGTRLRTMIGERGFDGSAKIVQRCVNTVRPRTAKKAYVVYERLPGEQGQVDWGHVGHLAVAGGMRALWVFVMLLAYSRMRYAELVLDMTAESLRRSILRAMSFLGGIPRQFLFDNPKIIVLERHGRMTRSRTRQEENPMARVAATVSLLVPAFALALGACSSQPAKAPGTNPEDMSVKEHRAKEQEHDQKAAQHEAEAAGPQPGGKAVVEEAQRREHRNKAAEEKDVAKQHGEAADKAAKP